MGVVIPFASAQDIEVNYEVTGGTAGSGSDFSLSSGTVTIEEGATSGTIVIQSREDDDKLNSILSKINHFETSIEAKVERKILSVLEGDCNTAAGIYANVKGKNVKIIAELFSDDGNKKFTFKV